MYSALDVRHGCAEGANRVRPGYVRGTNGDAMYENAILEGLISGGIATCLLIIGSLVMWLTVGKHIIKTQATKQLLEGLQDAYENPEGEYGQMVSNLAQLGLVAALKSLSELIPEDPNAPAHPMVNSMFRRFEEHIFKGIMASFGRRMQQMQKDGAPGAPAGMNPAGLMGMLGGLGGKGGAGAMGGLGDLMGLLQMFQGATGQGGGNTPPSKPGGEGWP